MAKKKTWREKLLDSKDLPKVVLMNYPAASSGVSKRKMFILCAASGGELNPQRSIKPEIPWRD
jgi:hypothetical protein